MNVRRIVVGNFMSHAHTDVALPDKGIVVVTGGNGSGKSSLVEAVSFALWGKTLRGSKPWREGERGTVRVETDCVTAERSCSVSAATKFNWEPAGWLAAQMALSKDLPEYETVGKAQEALDAAIGDHEVWRRACAFSSSDAAHFSTATDAERKRLLESVLGLERFDVALEKCKVLLKAATNMAQTDALSVGRVEAALQEARRSKPEPVEFDPAVLRAAKETLARLVAMDDTAHDEGEEAQKALYKLEIAMRAAGEELRSKEKELQRVGLGKCPTCGQDTDAVASALMAEVEQLREKAGAEVSALEVKRAEARSTVDQLGQERKAVGKRVDAARTLVSDALAQQREAERAATEAATHADRVADLEVTLVAAQKHLDGACKDAAELSACYVALGLRGVRAHILGTALGGIERAANAWLRRVAGAGMKLKLKSYTEKKTGGQTDAISMDVIGAGGGYGYKGASAGERRRIDVALLLALSGVAAASLGRDPGTLFADECFDALDADGVDAVSCALEDVAKDRAVVVVTHNEELAKSLNAAARWHVDQGKVTVL